MGYAEDLDQVRRALRGDVDAFGDLFERGFRCAWSFSTRQRAERCGAEALTEGILTRGFAALRGYSGEVSWPSWLGSFAAELSAGDARSDRYGVGIGSAEAVAPDGSP